MPESHRPSGSDAAYAASEAPHAGNAVAQAVTAATSQIGLALQDSTPQIVELGSLIAHVADTLNALRAAPFTHAVGDPLAVATTRGLIEQAQSDVYKAIQRLQFYDRLVQHLTHVQDYLLSVANQLVATDDPKAQRAAYEELNARLRSRLISDAQRGLLDLFLSPDTITKVSAQTPQPDQSAPGSLELF